MHKLILLYGPCGLMGWILGGAHLGLWFVPACFATGVSWALFYHWAFRPRGVPEDPEKHEREDYDSEDDKKL